MIKRITGGFSDDDLARLSGRKILLVEDSWYIADALASILRQYQIEVIGPASNLEAAQHIFATQKPEIAVVDLNLQDQMAFGLIEEMLAAQVKVIVTTGYQETGGLEDRNIPLLRKPVRAEQLLATLLKIL